MKIEPSQGTAEIVSSVIEELPVNSPHSLLPASSIDPLRTCQVALTIANTARKTLVKPSMIALPCNFSMLEEFDTRGDVEVQPSRQRVSRWLLASSGHKVIGLANRGNNCWANSILQVLFRAAPLCHAILSVPEYKDLRMLGNQYFGLAQGDPDTHRFRLMLHRLHIGGQISAEPVQQDASEALNLMLARVSVETGEQFFPRCIEIKQYRATGRTRPISIEATGSYSKLNANACLVKRTPASPQVFLDIQRVVDPRDPLGRVSIEVTDFDQMLARAFYLTDTANDEACWFLGDDPGVVYEHLPVCSQTRFLEKPSHLVLTIRRFHYDANSKTTSKDSTAVQVPRVLQLPESSLPHALDRRLVLRAFVVHIDNHYIAYVNQAGIWVKTNDSLVEEVTLQEVDQALSSSYIHYFEQGDADAEPPLVRVDIDSQKQRSQLDLLLTLSEKLEKRVGDQKEWIRLFSQLKREWQYRAMFWVWKAQGQIDKPEFGRDAIITSLLCLLDKIGDDSGAQRVIDHVIDEVLKADKKAQEFNVPVSKSVLLGEDRLLKLSTSSHTKHPLYGCRGLLACEQLIHQMGLPLDGIKRTIEIKPVPKERIFSQVTDIQKEAPLYFQDGLARQVRRVIDVDVIQYLSNPWAVLIKEYFEGQQYVKDSRLDKAAADFFRNTRFTVLNYKIIEHPDIPGWVLKGNTSQISHIRNAAGDTGNNRFDHLNRLKMSRILKEAAQEEGLLIDVPEVYIVDSELYPEDPELRYIVIQQKLPIMKREELIWTFEEMPYEKQKMYAEHLCRLIVKTGYSDAHFGNMTFLDGKFYIFDEEPMGVLRDQSDQSPSFNKTIEECAAIGLQRVIDEIGKDLLVFRVVAAKALVELKEKRIDEPEHRAAFHSFIRVMHDSQATTVERVEQFNKLNPQLKKFLGVVVATGLNQPSDNGYGEKRIAEQPEILTFLSNRAGIDVLRQIGVRFEIQRGVEILNALKEQLLLGNPSDQQIKLLLRELSTVFDGEILFEPIREKLNSLVESVIRRMHDATEEQLFRAICFRLLQARVPGSRQCLLDDLIGMLQLVKQDFSLTTMEWRLTRNYDPRFGASSNPTPSRPVPKDLVRISGHPIEESAKKLSVLIVAYECAVFGLKFGGLGEAIYGMAKGLAARGHHVTLLLPKFDKLPRSVTDRLKKIEEVSHRCFGQTKTDQVLGFDQERLSFRYLEDTRENEGQVDHYSVPDSKQIYVDGALAKENVPWFGLKQRMAYFANAAAAYADMHKGDTDIIAPQDWHGGGLLWKIAADHSGEWGCGRTPATVFVIHNNNYQGDYGPEDVEILRMFGDSRSGRNVMLDAMAVADQVVTVSPGFAVEMQQAPLGAGIDSSMRRLAYDGKLTGILNGSNPDLWNPADNSVLRDWVDPVTQISVPLNYSIDDQDILLKKSLIKEQLQKALEVYYPEAVEEFQLNLRDHDLVLYVGRYDSSQKGLERFSAMMRASHERGAAFVTMGVGEDSRATEILDALEEEAKHLGNAWITRGKADGFSIKMQLGDKEKGIPGLGPLLRAAAIYCIAPSNFEPCGLVQFEAWLFGTLVVATATGGLADTINSNPDDPEFNGFTFERLACWNSVEQDDLAYTTTLKAIDHWHHLIDDDKLTVMQRIMKSARFSSWTSAPKGLSPIEQYEKVFSKAITHAKQKRGIRSIDLVGNDEAPPIVDDHYFGEGVQATLYTTYGAHITRGTHGKVIGVRFQTMAPIARAMNVVIQDKDKECIVPMEALGNGAWSVFVEGAGEGTVYEYESVDDSGKAIRKADPFAFGSQLRPLHASVVRDPNVFQWSDEPWMLERVKQAESERPLNIYEVHLGSWRRESNHGAFMNYRQIAEELAEYAISMNYTHVELLGLFEHPSDESWGYQISGFFAPTSRHGSIEDFQYLVNALHEKGIGVIVDFVSYHFASDDWGLREFGGGKFFENSDLYHGETPAWGTRVFDLEREDIRNFLLSSAHFLLSKHVDGLRVDAVSELVTHRKYSSNAWKLNKEGQHWNLGGIELIHSLNNMVQTQFPGVITVAENSHWLPQTKVDTDPVEIGGLGFSRRWNMGWMSVSMKFLKADLDQKIKSFGSLIGIFDHHWQMKNISAISHDEVVHLKGSLYEKAAGSKIEKLAQVRMHHAFQTFFPGEGILTFMGNELAQTKEWDVKEEIQWDLLEDEGHRGVWELSRSLNVFYMENRPLWSKGIALSRFEWINIHPKRLILGYHRRDDTGRQLAIIFNFSNMFFNHYTMDFRNPSHMEKLKAMHVVFNTDSAKFGGSGRYDDRQVATILEGRDKKPKGFRVALPAYSAVVLEEEFV
ncbi:MAG: 1,4-alpha-glucan branching enzyme [Simkania sp.]|nr:1,4-alpha-glucan branching enzyme [Simkania sp.]